MSKQDRQGARTPAQLEQRYRFGQTFAQAMGLAEDAMETAEGAVKEATDAAEKKAEEEVDRLDRELTQAEIFKRLTNNGALKGLFMKNGELFINASYLAAGIISSDLIDTEKLIAQKLKSTNGTSKLNIDGAKLLYSVDGKSVIELCTDSGLPILYMVDIENGAVTNEAEMSAHHLKIGGTSMAPIFYVYGSGSTCKMVLNGGSPMTVEWRSNGDGTYSLVGTK